MVAERREKQHPPGWENRSRASPEPPRPARKARPLGPANTAGPSRPRLDPEAWQALGRVA
eukprot:8088926-Alexandrium_andersonii.AAC.1